MEMIAYIIVGCITGLLCRVVVTNARSMGLIRFVLVGMVGGIAGGIVGGAFNVRQEPFAVDIPSIVGSVLGAAIAVFVVVALSRNRAHV
ncbi:GlsB/YeaQ/YmgE family stress response membrane protein [Hyalangium gracile]|uniref:GlsB/YeaQ/YmgE family stress response membrane protein n=1 Tax=Hyalangium gracile TaxID=394092 RepID=UPI001CCCBD58|nr:GlsB/YeaQ/YmgE family stress response membrane protein [Hyalangium gracile]